MTVCIPESLALFSFSANICQLLHTNAITFNDCCKINAALHLDQHLWLHAFMHMGFDWDFAMELCTAFRVDISHCNDVELEFMDPDEFDSDLEDEEDNSEKIYVSTIRPRYLIVILKHSQTPPADFSSMLVFSPPALPQIFDSLITNFQPSLRNSQPANTLYLLARFACLTCDHNWLEDLIMGATDAIEETFFVSMSLSRLSFISLTIYRRTDRTILHVWCFGYTTLPCGYT